jgi:MFS family permease
VLAGFSVSFVVVGGGIDTVGVFVNAIAGGLGWSRSALSLGVSVGSLSAAVATPLVGLAIDRVGVRVPMTLGVALLAVGFAILTVMQAPWHFVAANLFLGAGFAACALLPLTVAITVCVRERTALALGIAAAGASAGALVLAPTLQLTVEALGWREAYVVLGAAVVVTPLPFLAFVLPRGRLQRTHQAEPGEVRAAESAGGAERPRSGIAFLAALMIFPGLVLFAVSVHLVPYLTGCGLSGRSAATTLGVSIGVSAIGKISGGWLADRIGALRVLRLALLLGAASFAFLLRAEVFAALVGFVACYGLSIGTQIAVIPPLARDVLGVRRFGTLFGALQLGAMVASAVGPIVAGLLFDATGRYTEAIGLWGAAMLCAVVVSLAMRMPAAELVSAVPEASA